MAVAEFQDQGWDQKDCDKLAEACKVENITVEKQVGGPPYGGPSAEALLDIQYIKSLGGAIPLTNIYSEPYSLLHWAQTLSAMDEPPLVNSVSYGNDEAQQTGVAYMESCNTQFKALGVRGLSILFASGDQGVCGREGCGIFTTHFHPGFPAASPYVTSVGAPTLLRRVSSGTRRRGKAVGVGFRIPLESPVGKLTQSLRIKATARTARQRRHGTPPAVVSRMSPPSGAA